LYASAAEINYTGYSRPTGTAIPPRSITDDQVQAALALKGLRTVRQIADEVGVSTGAVCNIHNGTFRTETNRELELAPGERYLEFPVRCGGCGGLLAVVPCRKCRTDSTMRKILNGPAEHCERCHRRGPTKHKGKQVRCGSCGKFLHRTDQPSQTDLPSERPVA